MNLINKSKEELIEEILELRKEMSQLKVLFDNKLSEKNNYQSLLNRIINLLPVRVFWKDLDLNYLGCNEVFANDAGKKEAESIIGKCDFDLNWNEEAENYRTNDKSVIETGISKLNFEEQQTTPEGKKIWLKTSKVPLTDINGNTIGILGTYEDITDQKNIETLKKRNTELLIANEKADKMASLGMLIAGVSHEINNPLNFIKGGVNEISKEIKSIDLEKQKEISIFINIINEGVNRAFSILKGLSHFSRDTDILTEQCDVYKIIDNCLVILNNKMKNRITIEKKYAVDSFILMGNDRKLHQAFLNILSNAEQAMPHGGTIRIESQLKNGQKVISFEDTGVGILKENMSKISDPFFTTKAPGEGTGLGLSITYKIIENIGGKINVSSTINKGSIFELVFN